MIIFLYGEDTYRSREKLSKIKNKFLEQDALGLNLVQLEGQFTYKDFQQAIGQTSFFKKTRLIIVEDVFTNIKGVQQKITDFLGRDEVSDSTVLVFWVGGPLDKRNALSRVLLQKATCEEFVLLSDPQLHKWVLNYVALQKARIEPKAIGELVLRIGNDLHQMHNELDKLIAYVDQKTITKELICTLVGNRLETDIFKLVDALSLKDREGALRFVADQMAAGTENLYLLAMIIYAFRNLIMVKDLQERGLSHQELVREAKLHPFVVRKTTQAASNFSFLDLKRIYHKLLDLDLKIKIGEIKPDFGLNMFVLGVTA